MSENETITTADVGVVAPREVHAIGVSARAIQNPVLQKLIQAAMTAEIEKCLKEGITTEEKNSPVIRQRMMAARARVIEEYRKPREGAAEPSKP